MRLSELLDSTVTVQWNGQSDPEIHGISCDSRTVGRGFLFIGVDGAREDGARYIQDAISAGAAAVMMAKCPDTGLSVPVAVAADLRKSIGETCNRFHRDPTRDLPLVGITGTNGKTTTAYLLRHLFSAAGKRCGMLGTIEYDLGDSIETAPLTTPDAVRFTNSLARMRDSACDVAVVEVSSHSLDQDRIWPHRFAGAVFTNLTRDHLDYHGDMESYLAAKRKLFARLGPDAVAVVNSRDPAAGAMVDGCRARVVGYAMGQAARPQSTVIHVDLLETSMRGQKFSLDLPCGRSEFQTPLVGRHNVENCAGAILIAYHMGISCSILSDAVASFPGVPGRLERITAIDGRTAFVDYAHTDDALRSVLTILRPLVKGRLMTVFGCGGDRDRGKRPLMAAAAESMSDLVVVTSDNPRTEDPEAIVADIMAGFSRPENVTVNTDREEAIRLAVSLLGPGDVLLVAGKGHENYQEVGRERRHLDDRELVRNAFA